MESIIRILLVVVVFTLIPACGGGGGGGAAVPPVVLLFDDFSGDMSNWTIGGSTAISAAAGNPAPSLLLTGAPGGQAYSVQEFDFTSGVTVCWDTNSLIYGGLNSGTPAAAGIGAMIQKHAGGLNCYLNGAIVYTDSTSYVGWVNFKLSVHADGTVSYYVNESLIYHSTMTISFSSPRGLYFLSTGPSYVDNIKVTVP